MKSLVLHPQSQERYAYFVADTPQSIVVVAPAGSGKETLLYTLAAEIAGEHAAGRIITIEPEPDKTTIGIDQIRDLKALFRLKSAESRIVVIPHAELLTPEAQNSFLKLLEEPPEHVHFFLAVSKLADLLETIQSRTTVWRLVPPTTEQIKDYFTDADPAKLEKAIAIGESRIGLITALVSKDADHELLQAIDTAKEILAESKFNRLQKVDLLSKDSSQCSLVIEALELIGKAALEHAAVKNSQSVKQWHRRLVYITEARTHLEHKVQPKLVLDWLFMKI